MGDSCGPRKRRRSSDDIVNPTSSGNVGIGNVQLVQLPHLVVAKILENLDFEDLLQCSLVCKIWNHEARRALREKHECALAVINLHRTSAKDLKKFIETTMASKLPVPYGSLSIKKDYPEPEQVSISWWELRNNGLAATAIKDFILRAGPYKVVKLDLRDDRVYSLEFWLTWNVLAEVLKTVQVLKIRSLGTFQLLFNLQGFPELKKLEVAVEAEINPLDIISLQNAVSNSPKLETVGCLSAEWLQLLETLPASRILAVAKEFTSVNMGKYRLEAAMFAAMKPKLEKLFVPRRFPYANARDIISRVSKSLLLSSQASLVKLQATYELLQEIRREKPLASFVNLLSLKLDIPLDMDIEGIRQNDIIVALFPNLERLECSRDVEDIDIFDYSVNDWLFEALDDFPDL